MTEVEVCCRSSQDASDLAKAHGEVLYALSSEGSVRIVVVGEAVDDRRPGRFRVEEAMKMIEKGSIGNTLVCFSKVPSTQDITRDCLRSLGPGVVVIADEQTAGRGRRGATWTSPEGCLTFSVGVSLPPGAGSAEKLPFLQYIAALAGLNALSTHKDWQCLDVRIKWPNDLLLNGVSKVAGILCEGVVVDGSFFISIGIGVNISNDLPTVSLQGQLQQSNLSITREEYLAAYLNALEPLLQVFRDNSFSALEDNYYASWVHTNQSVTLESLGGQSAKILGLGNTGGIQVRVDSSGEILELNPYETSLDMSSSIIRAKSASQ